jgi:MATE family multidrug resistance protein
MRTGDPPSALRELVVLAAPLVLSAGFLTVQLSLDRIFLTWNGNAEAAASMPAVLLFSTLFGILQHTVQYAAVFVSQYLGAGRPERVGPVLWQAGRVAVVGGFLFLLLIPVAGPLFTLVGHPPAVANAEADYFRALCYAVPAAAVVAVVNAFFSGRGKTWTVFAINVVGLGVNAPLAYGWILGEWGFPRLGPAGAGYATVCGAVASMVVGLALLLRKRYEAEAFVFLTGRMSELEGAATNVAFTINLVAFMPLVGVGQAVEILVGRRQGEGNPDRSAETTMIGLKLNVGIAVGVSVLYVVVPGLFTWPFGVRADPAEWQKLEPLVRTLLLFVAAYTVGDAVNVSVSFALRGAGDTRFVAWLAVGLAWPVLVVPTWIAAEAGWGVYGGWVFATVYIYALAVAFVIRFRGGKWRTMRVIEADVISVSRDPQGSALQFAAR